MSVEFVIAAPHAPQILSLPSTEIREQVESLRAKLKSLGQAITESDVDLLVVLSNDHADNFGTHCLAPFTIHAGEQFSDWNSLTDFEWPLLGSESLAITGELMEQGFDIAVTYDAQLGTYFSIPVQFMELPRKIPILPIYVNCYIPPQPTMQRCMQFGRALRNVFGRLGKKVAIIGSGGLSHYPGTKSYSNPGPDISFDQKIFGALKEMGPAHLAGVSGPTMDSTGNNELRNWGVLGGVIADARLMDEFYGENWHHTYAILAWTEGHTGLAYETLGGRNLYPPIASSNVAINRALLELRGSRSARDELRAGGGAFFQRHQIDEALRPVFLAYDDDCLRDEFGAHPLLSSGAMRLMKLKS